MKQRVSYKTNMKNSIQKQHTSVPTFRLLYSSLHQGIHNTNTTLLIKLFVLALATRNSSHAHARKGHNTKENDSPPQFDGTEQYNYTVILLECEHL